jgi:hypothetical protein
MEDENLNRRRYLKYTPEHMHCTCSFYGPMVPPNTGILAYLKPSRSVCEYLSSRCLPHVLCLVMSQKYCRVSDFFDRFDNRSDVDDEHCEEIETRRNTVTNP